MRAPIKKLPPLDELKRLLSYERATGIFRWRVKVNRNTIIGAEAGCINNWGYRQIKTPYGVFQAHRLAWLYETGREPTKTIDHEDLVKSNNAFDNLREATSSQQVANTRRQSRNTSGFRGVYRPSAAGNREKPWHAHIMFQGTYIFIGTFATAEEAARAHQAKAIELFGVFYRDDSNIPRASDTTAPNHVELEKPPGNSPVDVARICQNQLVLHIDGLETAGD